MKSRLLQLTRVAISLSLLGVLFWAMRGRINEIFDIIKNMNPGLFAVGFLAAIIAVAILGLRLRYLLATQGIPMGLRDSVSLSFIGFFFNNFLPTSVGGDIVKAYYASKKTRDKIGCFTTVFLDRLFGVSSLILLAAGSAALTHFYLANTSIVWPIFVILGLLSLFFIVLWNRNIARFALAPILILVRWPAINKRLALEEKLKKILKPFIKASLT